MSMANTWSFLLLFLVVLVMGLTFCSQVCFFLFLKKKKN
jgi:hypothetical protein